MTHPLPPQVAERLRALREQPIEPTQKGFGPLARPGGAGRAGGPGGAGGAAPLTAAALAAAGPPLHAAGLCYPLLVLREAALAGNIEAMAAWCARAGVALAPHGKTAMSPELAARQLARGAWGITVASISQLAAYRAFGFPRLLLANQLTDAAGIAWLAAELAADPGFEAYCYVDSADGVAILDRVLTRHRAGRRLPVLVEIGHARGRTGCRTDEAALAVARAAAATGTLEVAGVAGYEGSIAGPGQAQTLDLVGAFCRRLRALGEAVGARILTAGGSAYFDVVAGELTAGGTAGGATAILRSGAYLTYDHGLYRSVSPAGRGAAGAPPLRPALELWAQVLSRPEPGLALLGAGRRDAGFDKGLPVPLRAGAGWEVTELNDQHAYLRLPPDAALAPGDLVALGISHPCTTLDKWRVIPVVDEDDRVIDIVHTFF
jgi:D-serine dehydratase